MTVITDWREQEVMSLVEPDEHLERVITPQRPVVLRQILIHGFCLERLRIGAVEDVPFRMISGNNDRRIYHPHVIEKEIIERLVTCGASIEGPEAIRIPVAMNVVVSMWNLRDVAIRGGVAILADEIDQ